jgi:hypothetical protein
VNGRPIVQRVLRCKACTEVVRIDEGFQGEAMHTIYAAPCPDVPIPRWPQPGTVESEEAAA